MSKETKESGFIEKVGDIPGVRELVMLTLLLGGSAAMAEDAEAWEVRTKVNTQKLRDDAKNLYASAQQDRNEAAAAQARIAANNRDIDQAAAEIRARLQELKRQKAAGNK
jgi:hypothetical protein